jgi:hypothetical protein
MTNGQGELDSITHPFGPVSLEFWTKWLVAVPGVLSHLFWPVVNIKITAWMAVE